MVPEPRRLLTCLAAALALAAPSASALTKVVINEVQAANVMGIQDEDGDHEDWIELHNAGDEIALLAGYGLSDEFDLPFKWILPQRALGPGDRLLVFASGKDRSGIELHCNFKLDSDGELLTLAEPDGDIVDALVTGELRHGLSRGRKPDGDNAQSFIFIEPTPGETNTTEAFAGISAPPEFSEPAGFPAGPISLELAAGETDAVIHFSTDGSIPSDSTGAYAAPIAIAATTVVRARASAPGFAPSEIVTRSYFIGETADLPYVSVTTHPAYLWDTEIGIYVLGDDYEPEHPNYGANFWENWERPAHVEFFAPDRTLAFSQEIGAKIHGNWTRALPQKSLRLHARAGYGAPTIDYRVFPDKEIDEFRRLILRNSGNDWCQTHFRDGLMQDMTAGWDLERQAYLPALLFLNGQYWGIHNVRERIDEHYLAGNAGMDPDEVDILEKRGEPSDVIAGDNLHWQALLDYITTHDLAVAENYDHVRSQMDTDNFATYHCFEIYYANKDWPGNNVRFWRPRTPGGRWRWFIFDLDLGLGLDEPYTHDTVHWALDPVGGPYNPPWSTAVFRALMANAEFRGDFLNRYADLLNTQFLPPVAMAASAAARTRIGSQVHRHFLKWAQPVLNWAQQTAIVDVFLFSRPAQTRQHVLDEFGLAGTFSLELDVSPPGGGSIASAAIVVAESFTGLYWLGNPVPLRAEANPGYRFLGWSLPELPAEPEIVIDATGDVAVTALFEAVAPESSIVVINEINYNSADDFVPEDWVELYNRGEEDVDLGGWAFKDSDEAHVFTLAQGLTLPAKDYLVLCESLAAFQAVFPEVENVVGDLGFGLSGGGELIRLYDAGGALVDAVAYDDVPPWPPEADGEGPTLELTRPAEDNFLPEFWAASEEHGTPGAENSTLETAAPEGAPAAPGAVLLPAYPNPFNPGTRLAFRLERPQRARLTVHDVRGRLVAVLAEGRFAAGRHERVWRGVDQGGRGLPSGLYLARLATPAGGATEKLLLLK